MDGEGIPRSGDVRPRRRIGPLGRAVVLLLVAGVVVVALLTGLQRRLIYLPGQAVPSLPGWVEEVHATTADGLSLRGWVARTSRDQPLLIVFHGNGGTAADRLPLARAVRTHDVAVLLAEYRGYAGNPGNPSEGGLTHDAAAWRAWADQHHDGPVAYLGESIGAAVATRLAVAAPPTALVLRSPFTSLADVAAVHYPLLPVGLLLREHHEVADRVGQVDVPVLVVLGTADRIVPPAQSRAVHAAAGDRARLLEVPGVGHNDLALLAGEVVVTAIAELLAGVR